jgi:transposase
MFVGVDIAAKTFTATWGPCNTAPVRPTVFAQNSEGFAAFHHALTETGRPADATLVVMEATGSYWVALAVYLYAAAYQVVVVNPAHIHNYAKSLPRRSKTDALDARVLWQFATERVMQPWTPPPLVYHELRQRLVARDAVAEMRQQARNQRHALQQWPIIVDAVIAHFDAIEAELDGRLAQLDADIGTLLRDGTWAESAGLLQSIPGIGPVTTAWLLVATMNFQLCATPATAVAFAGLAPLQHESGTSIRSRPYLPRGGHARLRRALYLASLSAARHNPRLKFFYDRLRAAGKPPRVARCATARKLLHIAWAVVTKRQPFDPAYSPPCHQRPALA